MASIDQIRKYAKVLMAGEDVLWMGKPNKLLVLGLEILVTVSGFVVGFAFTSIFSDLPNGMKSMLSLMFALLAALALYCLVAMRTYILTGKRLIVISDITHEVAESCSIEEITEVTKPGFGQQLLVHRQNANPVRLIAVPDRDRLEQELAQLKSV
jgi:hypothetical protein